MTYSEIMEKMNALFVTDEETGEVTFNAEDFEALEEELTKKRESVLMLIKAETAMCAAIKAEEKALADRRNQHQKRIDSLTKYAEYILEGEAFETARCKATFRNYTSVNVLDMELIPAEFLRSKVTVEPNKVELAKRLKNGETISGCELQTTRKMQVQ